MLVRMVMNKKMKTINLGWGPESWELPYTGSVNELVVTEERTVVPENTRGRMSK